jgi:hypothetical protein
MPEDCVDPIGTPCMDQHLFYMFLSDPDEGSCVSMQQRRPTTSVLLDS